MNAVVDWYREAFADPMFISFPVVTSLLSMAAFVVFATPLTLIAWRDPAALRRFRIQRRREMPQRLVGASIGRWLVNNAVLFALVVAAWPLFRQFGVHRGPLPPWWQIVGLVLLFIYFDDFAYYWMHRAMHRGWLFRHIHSVHHRIHTPWAITGHYMHPVEYVLTGTLMLVLPLALGVHLAVIWIWVVWRQWEAAEGHCGYDFRWSPSHLLPGNDGATFHDVHHAKVKGNYAGFLAWVDGVFGTYSRGYAQDRARRHTHATPTDA